MKVKLLILALLPLLFASCDMNDLFDEGDINGTYDGPTVVAFDPPEREVSDDGGSTSIEIQLIGEQRDSDLAVSFSVDGESSAEAGTHYNVTTSSPVTLAAGASTVDVEIELISDSVPDGGEVQLIINLDGGDGVEVAENYKSHRVFIQG